MAEFLGEIIDELVLKFITAEQGYFMKGMRTPKHKA